MAATWSAYSTRPAQSGRSDLALLPALPGSGLRRPTLRTLRAGTSLVRLYDPTRYGTQALTFTHNGPRGRFDHHRPPPAGSGPTWDDPDRGIYYVALTLSCCLVEVFGDTRLIDRPQLQVAMPTLTRDLRLLDLRGAALSGEGDRALTQAWSRYFYEEGSLQHCDGLMYRGPTTRKWPSSCTSERRTGWRVRRARWRALPTRCCAWSYCGSRSDTGWTF